MTSYYIGNGHDGDLTISANRTEDSVKSGIASAAAAAQKVVNVTDASSFAANDYILIIQIQGTGVGGYEFNKIASIATNAITMKGDLINSYAATGAQVIKVFEYNSVTVNSGGNWNSSAWNGTVGGVLVVMSKGAITFNAGSVMYADAKGFAGGASNHTDGYQGKSATGNGTKAWTANGSGGGGGQGIAPQFGGGGGGGNSTGSTAGTDAGGGRGGQAGAVGGSATLETAILGGGGGGGAGVNDPGAVGGTGGGMIILVAGGDITLSGGSNGSISALGSAGSVVTAMGGGGGAGGSMRFITSGTVALGTSKIVATGGAGGDGSYVDGGVGGTGRIATISTSTVTGTSNPAIDETSSDITIDYDPFRIEKASLPLFYY